MADVVIENPILNSPFREPSRHWRFGDTGITNEVVEGRRVRRVRVAVVPAVADDVPVDDAREGAG